MRNLVSYKPRSLDLFEDFDRLFDSFFTDSTFTRTTAPRVDIKGNDEDYVLVAELPGLAEKDVEVKVEDNLLTISSKSKEDKEEERNGYILRERRHSSFSRSFVLPKDVDREKIEAGFSNGLLTLHLGKTAETKPKMIEVKNSK